MGLVSHRLARRDDFWKAEFLAEFARNARQLGALRKVSAALAEAGLEGLVLKGAALVPTLYGGRLGLRSVADIDLLLREGVAPALDEVVDLHLDILNTNLVPARARIYRLERWAFWERALPLPGYPGLYSLAPEDQFIHLAIHALKHSYERLSWLVDLALLLPQVDQIVMLSRATHLGAERPVAYALALIGDSNWRFNWLENWFLQRVRLRAPHASLGELLPLTWIPDWSTRLAYLRDLAWPRGSRLWPRLTLLWDRLFQLSGQTSL